MDRISNTALVDAVKRHLLDSELIRSAAATAAAQAAAAAAQAAAAQAAAQAGAAAAHAEATAGKNYMIVQKWLG